MSNTLPSANMALPIPVPGVDPGPDWANQLNAALAILDSHTHSSGSGVAITPAGLNINSALPFNNKDATSLRSIRLQAQSAALSGSADLSCLYANGIDLYYNDGSGTQIRLTQSGAVAGTPGSIASLVSPASATYVSATQTFVWQSAANTPGNLDAGFLVLRNNSASSHGLTLFPPASMAADYSLTLPALPASQKIMTLDASGNMSAPYSVDNSTIAVSANVIGVAAGGITPTQIATGFGLTPAGVIDAFGGAAAPAGYLLCDGTSYLRATYPALFAAIGTAYGTADSTHFNVPDLRGQFLRGVTGSSTNDPDTFSRTANNAGGNTGDSVGSAQADQFGNHAHGITMWSLGNNGSNPVGNSANSPIGSNSTGGAGGNETRPKNVYVNFIIKT